MLKNKNDESTHNTHTGSSNRKHGTGVSLVDSVERSLFASHLANPRAETDTHYVSMAFHESLDVAEKEALLDMIRCVISFTFYFISVRAIRVKMKLTFLFSTNRLFNQQVAARAHRGEDDGSVSNREFRCVYFNSRTYGQLE